jgi:hypothetical protein
MAHHCSTEGTAAHEDIKVLHAGSGTSSADGRRCYFSSDGVFSLVGVGVLRYVPRYIRNRTGTVIPSTPIMNMSAIHFRNAIQFCLVRVKEIKALIDVSSIKTAQIKLSPFTSAIVRFAARIHRIGGDKAEGKDGAKHSMTYSPASPTPPTNDRSSALATTFPDVALTATARPPTDHVRKGASRIGKWLYKTKWIRSWASWDNITNLSLGLGYMLGCFAGYFASVHSVWMYPTAILAICLTIVAGFGVVKNVLRTIKEAQ